ncbi:MAG TPA: hypothetical protein VLV49_05075 [Terriglobales bacterium]|nr:hypothetical protein [Terriglobales bacterium]
MGLTIFIALTVVALAIQAGVLVALYIALRKASARMEVLGEDIRTKLLPAAESAHSLLVELRPKLETAATNLSESSTMVRSQLERLDATVNDAIDRTRLQVIRADELVSRTLDRVEDTTEIVHHSVISPVRQFAGILRGVTVGLEFLMGSRRRRDGVHVPQDEMFI